MQRPIKPPHDRLRDAVRWLADREPVKRADIETASVRFDLGPLDEEFLLQHFIVAANEPRSSI